jgi:hypothetical protein
MTDPSTALREAFLDDHKHLTRGLTRTLQALRDGDDANAIQLADTMDRAVGAHMAFEEDVFYPKLAAILGEGFVEHLEEEHEIGQQAVKTLLSHTPGEPLTEEERMELIEGLDTMLDHAVGCGTLLSHLDGLQEAGKKELLDQLLELRRRGVRWTELDHPAHRASTP